MLRRFSAIIIAKTDINADTNANIRLYLFSQTFS